MFMSDLCSSCGGVKILISMNLDKLFMLVYLALG